MERAIENLADIIEDSGGRDLRDSLRSFAVAIASEVRAGLEVELRTAMRQIQTLEDRTAPLQLVGTHRV